MEVWLHAFAFPRRTAELARRAEPWGYDGMLVADSQNLNADVWVELALAAAATERLKLGPGVTNTATRHPAVTASAAATLQAESGGRAVLGLGRGDSALAQIGREPVPVAEFEAQLARIVGLLRGEEVELDDGAPSEIQWIAESPAPAVPVAVAASGPQVIAAGARHAQQLDFTVGAEPDRLRWAIATAARGRRRRERPSLGAFLDVAVDPDRARARDLVRGSASILARFGAEGAPPDGLSAVTREGIARLAADFDESHHGQSAHRRRPRALRRVHRPLRRLRPRRRGRRAAARPRRARPRAGDRRPRLARRRPRGARSVERALRRRGPAGAARGLTPASDVGAKHGGPTS